MITKNNRYLSSDLCLNFGHLSDMNISLELEISKYDMATNVPWYSYESGTIIGFTIIPIYDNVFFNLSCVYKRACGNTLSTCIMSRRSILIKRPGNSITSSAWPNQTYSPVLFYWLKFCIYKLSANRRVKETRFGLAMH